MSTDLIETKHPLRRYERKRPTGNSPPMRENEEFCTASTKDAIPTRPVPAVTIYCCYHKNKRDRALWEQLARHFAVMRRLERVVIHDCYDIPPGSIQEHQCNAALAGANIILLLLSADFVYDDFCWETMLQALQRHERGTACLIPILLRPFHYKEAPFARFQILLKEKPLTKWSDLDEACEHIVKGVDKMVEELRREREEEIGVGVPAAFFFEEREQLAVQTPEMISLLNIERRVSHNDDGKH